MDLTDDELMAVYSAVHDEAYYGDDWIVYADPGDDGYVDALRAGLEKLNAEAKERKLI